MTLALGVCSWSLQVRSIPELRAKLNTLGLDLVQIACGDPLHADWEEGEGMPAAARAAGLNLAASMLGFRGEDYTSPQTIRRTGGFTDPATRAERFERLAWGLCRTRELGLICMTLHAGFMPEPGDPERRGFLDALGHASELAQAHGVVLGLETGQETAALLRRTLEEVASPFLQVNFDPANMLLYDRGDPIEALEVLGGRLCGVHAKDGRRPRVPGQWGEEVPLGQGEVDWPRFVATLEKVGYGGPLCMEREVGTPEQRLADIAGAIRVLRDLAGGLAGR